MILIFTKASASANRINELLDTAASINDMGQSSLAISNENTPAMEFKDVSFSYSSTGDIALENISITIEKGETIGIIGGTGSGKSTFINLIPRLYDIDTGKILINNVNIKDYPLVELRNIIGIVPQKSELFSGTIIENLRLGNKLASEEEVIKASKIAQAHEFISTLPDGYNTKVSRGGANFSGGQKQRLTIARALIKKPSILILDDSSSALDFATDAALRNALKENLGDMTVLIVSQRVSTIKDSNKIIVFDDGYIAGVGTHSQLMTNCEIYKEICLSQLSNEEANK